MSLFVFIASFQQDTVLCVLIFKNLLSTHIWQFLQTLSLFLISSISIVSRFSFLSHFSLHYHLNQQLYLGLIRLYQQFNMVFQKFCLYSHDKCISQLIWNNFLEFVDMYFVYSLQSSFFFCPKCC